MNWESINTGQIKLNQKLGQWIQRYATDTTFRRYIEIGSWNGKGSTVCFASGFHSRGDDFEFKSFEINEARFQESKNVWKSIPSIQIHHGRILETMPDVRNIHANVAEDWQRDDEYHFSRSPYFNVDNYKPQVALLDGGEYITYFEYQRLKPYVTIFLLDDTDAAKCKRIVDELSIDLDWKCIDSGHERNGWAVFQKVTN
jgi:hypothetical protein